MIYTTPNKIRAHSPCESSWKMLLAKLGKTAADDEPVSMGDILDWFGLEDCCWAMRSLPEHDSTWRLFACDCAERALMRERGEGREPHADSWRAVNVARSSAMGEATDEDLAAARDAAWAAARDAAWVAARAAAWGAARGAARDAAWAAAWDAARDAARAAAWAAAWDAARDAARGAAWDAARAAEREWQAERLRWYLENAVREGE